MSFHSLSPPAGQHSEEAGTTGQREPGSQDRRQPVGQEHWTLCAETKPLC